jgi:hypothetical protein
MALKSVDDPDYTNPYGIPDQEANIRISKKLIAERQANEAQLIAEQAKYSRQEQKRLEAEAAAAAARGDSDAAAKAAAAKQYADEKASVAADLERNGRLLQRTEQGLQTDQATLARMQAKQASIPPGTQIVNAGSDPAAQSPPTVPTLSESTASSYSPATVEPNNSPYASQRAQQNEQIQSAEPEPISQGNSPYASQRTQQNEQIQSAEPAPVEPGSLAETQNNVLSTIQTNPVSTPGAVPDTPAATGVFANPNFSQEAISGVTEPEAVSAATPGTPGAESAFNQGALGTRAPAPVDDPTAAAAATPAVPTVETAAQQAEREARDAAAAEQAAKLRAQQQAAIQAEFQTPANGDWRVRLRLAPGATYLYKDADNKLLAPLAASDGVVFPYMPTIGTTYSANYDQTDLVHSNYKGYFYRNSAVDAVSITGKFTAQDTFEATYMLAVIHFFRSVTKMFYGQDWQRGAPPPLVFLSGLGEYQFNNHPCVVSSFNYSLPNDVDYIRTKPNNYNVDLSSRETKPDSGPFSEILGVVQRLKNAALPRGAVRPVPEQGLVTAQSVNNTQNSTYVPTSLDITISLLPINTRKQISQGFSVQEFSKGTLLRKGFW